MFSPLLSLMEWNVRLDLFCLWLIKVHKYFNLLLYPCVFLMDNLPLPGCCEWKSTRTNGQIQNYPSFWSQQLVYFISKTRGLVHKFVHRWGPSGCPAGIELQLLPLGLQPQLAPSALQLRSPTWHPVMAWRCPLTCSTIPPWSHSHWGPLGLAVSLLPPDASATSQTHTLWWSVYV